VLWECYSSVTIYNVKLQTEVNFPYCMDSIDALVAIVTSTTIAITTITITTIRYFTLTLLFQELYVIHPCQLSAKPDHTNFISANAGPLLPTKPNVSILASPNPLLQVKSVSHQPAKPDPPLPAFQQRSQFHPNQRSQIRHYQLASSKASVTPTSKDRLSEIKVSISAVRQSMLQL